MAKPKIKKISREDFVRDMEKNKKLFPTTHGRKLTKDQRREIVIGFTQLIGRYLTDGYIVQFPVIGALRPTQRSEKVGVNPRTGKKLVIPAQKSAAFYPTDHFKAVLNGADHETLKHSTK